jgi:hypothetical protein
MPLLADCHHGRVWHAGGRGRSMGTSAGRPSRIDVPCWLRSTLSGSRMYSSTHPQTPDRPEALSGRESHERRWPGSRAKAFRTEAARGSSTGWRLGRGAGATDSLDLGPIYRPAPVVSSDKPTSGWRLCARRRADDVNSCKPGRRWARGSQCGTAGIANVTRMGHRPRRRARPPRTAGSRARSSP